MWITWITSSVLNSSTSLPLLPSPLFHIQSQTNFLNKMKNFLLLVVKTIHVDHLRKVNLKILYFLLPQSVPEIVYVCLSWCFVICFYRQFAFIHWNLLSTKANKDSPSIIIGLKWSRREFHKDFKLFIMLSLSLSLSSCLLFQLKSLAFRLSFPHFFLLPSLSTNINNSNKININTRSSLPSTAKKKDWMGDARE